MGGLLVPAREQKLICVSTGSCASPRTCDESSVAQEPSCLRAHLLCRTDQLPEEARPGCELQEHLLEAPIGLMPLFIRAMHIARLQANVPTYAFSKDVT